VNTLYLTPSEKMMYEALPESLREGWSVTDEIEHYERAEELDLRYRMADFMDPACKELLEAAKGVTNREDFEKVASQFDISSLSQEQTAELFFILGSKIITYMMSYLFQSVENDEDIEGISGLSAIRHLLFETNAEHV
jgi:hypothetical protein